MKIIDLLNKIANDEEVPNKIKYAGIIWEYDNTTKDYISDDMFLIYKMNSFALNKSFEILEEEPRDIEVCGSWITKSEYDKLAHCEEEKKIPEKLPYYSMEKIQKAKNKDEWREERITLLEKRVEDLHIKMNDLLDYLKSKGDE